MVVRFNTEDVTIHLASAGCGKTTTAMQIISEALGKYRPDEIAFVTYTRKGVETGIERALAVNKELTPDDLMHFKTLHALCFRESHLVRKNIITKEDIDQFNAELGFHLTLSDAFGHVTEDDRLLQRYDAERSGSKRGVFVDGNYDRFRYERLINAYKAFKEGHDLVDFYDCLLRYMKDGEPLQGVKIALIDECFAPDTKVRMSDGTVREIKDIKVGDYVMGVRGPVRVTEVHAGTDTMYSVRSMKGELLFKCNSKHLIKQYTGYITDEWNHAENLVNDHTGVYVDRINYRCLKQHATYAMVQVAPESYGEYVGITVDSDDHLFLLANGCVVHNCQDLTPLQWQVCMKAFSEAEKVICLGDDFQCQPAGTKVLTEHGYVPIEACGGQRLITLDLETMTYKKSAPVQLESHRYVGVGYRVDIVGMAPQFFTAEHKMVTRVYGELRVIPIAVCYGLSHRGLRMPLYDEEEPWNTSISQPVWATPYITEGHLDCMVYSLNVPEYHTYVTEGGLTVHNCLYTYNGAAPELLVEMASHYRTIKHEISYRLPRKVYEFSKGITDLIQEKVEKNYAPAKDKEGFVETVPDRSVLARKIRDDLKANGAKPGRWFLLFRTNCFISDMSTLMEQFIVPYHTSKGFCIPERELSRIERYYNYRKQGFGSDTAKKHFMEEYKIEDINDSFMHSELIPGKERYFFQDLVDTWGIDMLKEMSKMSEPFCLLSTVHRVKGGEADFAAMFMDCTRVVSENITLNADEELRVLYVGCTRCREGLYIVPSSGKYSLSRLMDIVKELNDG